MQSKFFQVNSLKIICIYIPVTFYIYINRTQLFYSFRTSETHEIGLYDTVQKTFEKASSTGKEKKGNN